MSYKECRKRCPDIQNRAGYAEIVTSCNLARQRRLEWAWIDTCCIDKRSSAELSESINSTWRYYEQAAECYVVLNDFQHPYPRGYGFEHCQWLQRGWTLQELLAPTTVVFFGGD